MCDRKNTASKWNCHFSGGEASPSFPFKSAVIFAISSSETSGFATPGLRNSQYSEVIGDGSSITVDPEIFSPDNDGTNDVTNITYHFDEPGFTANVDVFDDRGRLITHLVKNQLLGTDGSWSWNGITDKNEKARIGIYIIYMEAFDLKGAVKKYKKTCQFGETKS